MGLYESIQQLIETTSLSPDTVMFLFGTVFFVHTVCEVAVWAFWVWAIPKVADWLLAKVAKRKQ